MPKGTPRDKQAPVVNITFPANNANIDINSNLTITVDATDNRAVGRVEIYIGGILVASDTTAPYSYTWAVPGVGGNQIMAKAIDTSGNFATHSIWVNRVDPNSSTTTTTTIYQPPAPILPSRKIIVTPTAFNQGGEGSCTAMSLALLRSAEQYYITAATSYSQSVNIMSPEFIYDNNVGITGCGGGMTVLNGLNFIYGTGVCRWSILPYTDQNGCDVSLCTQASYDDAANYKLVNYRSALANDIYSIKRHLVNNHVGIFSCQLDKNFADGGQITINGVPQYDQTTVCNYVWNSRGYLMYTHALTIIGYNDAKQAFLLQNSWGTNWACDGKLWVDYSFFATITGYVYFMTTRNDQNYFPIL